MQHKELIPVEDEVYYFHLKHFVDRITIAAAIEDNIIYCGFAFCKRNDRFIKSKGRSIAQKIMHRYNSPYTGDFIHDICHIFNNVCPADVKPTRWKRLVLAGNKTLDLTIVAYVGLK